MVLQREFSVVVSIIQAVLINAVSFVNKAVFWNTRCNNYIHNLLELLK